MATFHLIIEPSAGGRYEHRLAAGIYVLGREQESCDLAIASPEISRRHVRLTLSETQCTVEDLGSTSGTYRGGETVRESRAFAYPVELHLGTVRLAITLANQSADQTNGSGIAGHYTKGAEIAKGGMGAVLEANDQLLGRTVAMKVVRHDIGDSESIRLRFIREATVLARLEHPSIVPIYEMGRDSEGRLFYTMKKVEGRTLQAILNDLQAGKAGTVKEYTLDRLLNIYRKICDAMAFAHDRGVIHRDLKPENVMVGEYGEVLVMDWGLAKILQDAAQSAVELQLSNQAPGNASGTQLPTGFQELSDSQMSGSSQNLTLDGAVMGSPQYMPPEQAEGKVGEIDERSDIFSLGGILYSILTLKPPAEGRTIKEVLDNVKSGKITPPTHYNTGSSTAQGEKLAQGTIKDPKLITPLPHCPGGRVPSALSSVTMKAMAFAPEDRYAEVEELAHDVEAYQQGFATSAEQVSAMGQVVLFVKRHKGVSISAGVALVLIMFLSLGFMLKVNAEKNHALRAQENAVIQADKATKAEAVAVKKEAETSKALARSALSLAEAALREGNGPAMQGALNEVPENLRDSTWRYLLSQSDTSIARIDVGAEVNDVAAHPRLPSVFALVDQRGKVTVLNVRTGERLLEFAADLPRGGYNFKVAISPDGERIAVGLWAKAGGLVIHSARDGRKLLSLSEKTTICLEFSPDGRSLIQVEGGDSNLVQLWDATTGRNRWTYDAKRGVPLATFTPDGRQVLLQSNSGSFQMVSAEKGELIRQIGESTGPSAAIRPDGKLIVTGNTQGIIRGFDPADGRAVFEFRTDDRLIDQLAFTASGGRFISMAGLSDGRQAIRLWDGQTGAPVQSLLGGSGMVKGASVHPLSGELVVCGPNTRVWSLSTAKWTLRRAMNADASLAFWGEDDTVFAPATKDAVLVRLHDDTTTPIWTPAGPNYNIANVCADGRFAALGKISQTPVSLVQRNGPTVEQIGSLKLNISLRVLRLSPQGKRVAVIGGVEYQELDVFDTATGTQPVKLARPAGPRRASDLGWLSEEHLLGLVTTKAHRGLADAEEQIVVWDVTTGKVLRSTTNPSAMDTLALAPDGRRFAEAGADKNVRIRDTATLAVLKEFRVHDDAVTALAWHPKKPILATGSADLTIRLWNLETGERIDEFRGPIAAPHTLAFSPSGQRLGCASKDGSTRFWDPPSLLDSTAPQLKAGSGVQTGK